MPPQPDSNSMSAISGQHHKDNSSHFPAPCKPEKVSKIKLEIYNDLCKKADRDGGFIPDICWAQYWEALRSYIRGNLTKVELDFAIRGTLGRHCRRALRRHNFLILALLQNSTLPLRVPGAMPTAGAWGSDGVRVKLSVHDDDADATGIGAEGGYGTPEELVHFERLFGTNGSIWERHSKKARSREGARELTREDGGGAVHSATVEKEEGEEGEASSTGKRAKVNSESGETPIQTATTPVLTAAEAEAAVCERLRAFRVRSAQDFAVGDAGRATRVPGTELVSRLMYHAVNCSASAHRLESRNEKGGGGGAGRGLNKNNSGVVLIDPQLQSLPSSQISQGCTNPMQHLPGSSSSSSSSNGAAVGTSVQPQQPQRGEEKLVSAVSADGVALVAVAVKEHVARLLRAAVDTARLKPAHTKASPAAPSSLPLSSLLPSSYSSPSSSSSSSSCPSSSDSSGPLTAAAPQQQGGSGEKAVLGVAELLQGAKSLLTRGCDETALDSSQLQGIRPGANTFGCSSGESGACGGGGVPNWEGVTPFGAALQRAEIMSLVCRPGGQPAGKTTHG